MPTPMRTPRRAHRCRRRDPRRAADERSGSSFGQPDLDRFFEHNAGPNQCTLHLAISYVAVVEGRVDGFPAVAASLVERAARG